MNALKTIYKLVLRHQVTRSRLALGAVFSALCVLLGFTVVRQEDGNKVDLVVQIVSRFGLGLIIPIVCLVLASAAIGEWRDDETLVYVWLRPVKRVWIALGAFAAVLTASIPINLTPLVLTGWSGGVFDGKLLAGTAAATVLATVAYSSLFVLLGLVVKKALAFGFIYVFIWEFLVAGIFSGAAKFSINSYATSALARITESDEVTADRAMWTSWVVPIAVAVVGVALTSWRLDRTDVA